MTGVLIIEFTKKRIIYKENGYLSKPKILQLEITSVCPLHCPQCYKEIKPRHAKIEQMKKVAEDAKIVGISSVMINGGEPITHPNFLEIVHLISEEYNMKLYLFLSGYKLSEEYIKKLNHKNIFLTISLNGSTKDINHLSRDGYDYTINAIKLLKTLNVNYGINWVFRHDNVDDFSNLVNLAVRNNAKWINIIYNKISNGIVYERATQEDYQNLVQKIKLDRSKIDIRVEGCNYLLNLFLKNDNHKLPILFDGCLAARAVCFVDLEGNFMPCSHLFYPEKFEDIMDYWNNSAILKEIRLSNKIIKCKDCIIGEKCFFCKASTKETHDNFYKGFDKCIYKKT